VRDLAVLFLHLLATVARLAGPGGARSVVAESVLVKHQLLILNRSRKRVSGLTITTAACHSFQTLDSQTQSIRSACVSRSRCGRDRFITWS
jgi:hypothetical protein